MVIVVYLLIILASVTQSATTKLFNQNCTVLEELAFQGYQMTSPAYYDIVLKGKYMCDSSDTAAQLIDMIHDLAYTETGYAYTKHQTARSEDER